MSDGQTKPHSDHERWLARINTANVALFACQNALQAKQIADVAKGVEVIARRQKAGEVRLRAHAVYVDAVAYMGRFLERAEKHSGGRPTKTGTVPVSTLREYGITKNESSLAQLVSRAEREEPEPFAKVRDDREPLQAIRAHFRNGGRRRIRFTAFDDFGGESTPVAAAVIGNGGVISATAAKAKGRYARNPDLWDDKPALAHPTHKQVLQPQRRNARCSRQRAAQRGAT